MKGGLGLAAMAGFGTGGSFAQNAGPVEIVFASPRFFDLEAITTLLGEYNASQNAVRAVYRELPGAADPDAVRRELKGQLNNSEDAPDVFSLDIIWIAEFASEGFSLPLDTHFEHGLLDEFYPGIAAGCSLGGRQVAMPWFVDCGMLFYRRDLLESEGLAVPKTWQDLAAAVRAVKGDTVPYGYLWQGKRSEALVCNAVSVIGSNGGTILEADGRTVRIAEPEAVEAITFLRSTFEELAISPADVRQWDEEGCRIPFQEGRAAFLRNWGYTWNLAHRPGSVIAGSIGVAPLPHFPGKSSATCLGGYQLAISARTKKAAAAADFLQWLTGPSTQLYFARQNGLIPTRRAVFDDPALQAENPFMSGLKTILEGAIARPVTPKYPEITKILQKRISAALADGQVEVELSTAKAEMEAVISD